MSGGCAACTYDLINAMHKHTDMNVDLLTVGNRKSDDKLKGNNEEWITALKNDCVSPYAYSKNMTSFLNDSDYDIYHTNGLWMHANHATCAVARKKHKPYIISTHGMLYPEALHQSYWKKLPFIIIHFKKDIMQADCIQVTCQKEMETVRQFGYKGPVAVIPNAVPLNELTDRLYKDKQSSVLSNGKQRTFGFLGFLYPKKKVENLLYALHSLGDNIEDSRLLIIGTGDIRYEHFLHMEAKRLRLKNTYVDFMGFVSEEKKYQTLASLSCLFVPSNIENFGVIVAEALAVGTPVMASLGTPWEELNTRNCGWWTDREPETIAKVMRTVIAMPADKLLQMGKNGRQLVEEKYAGKVVAQQTKQLYNWIAGSEPNKPAFVYG